MGVTLSDDAISVTLADGRIITVPYLWYPRLYFATPQQRADWEWIGDGIGIHWEDIDEDIEVAALLHSGPAPRNSPLAIG